MFARLLGGTSATDIGYIYLPIELYIIYNIIPIHMEFIFFGV